MQIFTLNGIEVLIANPVPQTVEEPESKALPKLAITYGVLRRLGFSDTDVCHCLESISGIEIDDAIEWVGSYFSE